MYCWPVSIRLNVSVVIAPKPLPSLTWQYFEKPVALEFFVPDDGLLMVKLLFSLTNVGSPPEV